MVSDFKNQPLYYHPGASVCYGNCSWCWLEKRRTTAASLPAIEDAKEKRRLQRPPVILKDSLSSFSIQCAIWSPPRGVTGAIEPERSCLGTAFSLSELCPLLKVLCPVIVLLLLLYIHSYRCLTVYANQYILFILIPLPAHNFIYTIL